MLGTNQAGDYLGISVDRVTRLCENGKLKGCKSELGWEIDPASVKAYKNTPRKPGPPKGSGGMLRKEFA